MLAYQPPGLVEEIARRTGLPQLTKNTITDLGQLQTALGDVRHNGYALDDTEHEEEIRCVACPVRDHNGEVIAAVSLTVPASRMTREEILQHAPLVRECAEQVSQAMGYAGDVQPMSS